MTDKVDIRLVETTDEALILAQSEGLFDYAPDPEQTRAFLSSPLCEMVIAVDGDTILSFASGTILLHPDKDPSMFINQMLRRFYGNKQFAANVMRLYCEPEACRVKLARPLTTSTGR